MNCKDIVLHKIPRLEKERGIYTFLLITITTFITHFYFSRLKKKNLAAGPILHLKLPHKFIRVWFIAKTEKQREHTEQTKNIRPVVERISPNPTNRETIPPKAKPAAPNNAEAVPELARSQSMSKVVEAVKVNPIEKSNTNSTASYTTKRYSLLRITNSTAISNSPYENPLFKN